LTHPPGKTAQKSGFDGGEKYQQAQWMGDIPRHIALGNKN